MAAIPQPQDPTGSPTAQGKFADRAGMPGGWGEAAEYAVDIAAVEEALMRNQAMEAEAAANSSRAMADAPLSAQGSSSWMHWGTCATGNCGAYQPGGPCQCNSACTRHRNCCLDRWLWCWAPAPAPVGPAPSPGGGGHIMTLYHQTSPSACSLIIQNGFRPGSVGWCGGGIYFATSAKATFTKAIGPDSHQGCILRATVDVGRVKYLSRTCDRSLNGAEVASQGHDSVSFDPGDGQEYVVYSKSRVISVARDR